jgi:DNA polymerase I-like protein with 3'-5' exonuclease and polymerase domains
MTRLNCQGLARACPSLVGSILPEPGYQVVSVDLQAGEPTCTTAFSKDPNYYSANFGMVGKTPYYDAQGVLQISCIYLMVASISPFHKDKMREAFNSTWNGKTFAEQWLEDDDVIKSALKKDIRQLSKILVLGLGYGMGVKKMVRTAYENDFVITTPQAKEFKTAYWDLFKRVQILDNLLKVRFKRKGFLVNPFGYRIVPDSDHKVFNQYIQSTVSGIMHVLMMDLFQKDPDYQFITCLHDEVLTEVPSEKLQQFRNDLDDSVEKLNQRLNWNVKIRTGFKPGENWYAAK